MKISMSAGVLKAHIWRRHGKEKLSSMYKWLWQRTQWLELINTKA